MRTFYEYLTEGVFKLEDYDFVTVQSVVKKILQSGDLSDFEKILKVKVTKDNIDILKGVSLSLLVNRNLVSKEKQKEFNDFRRKIEEISKI